MRVLSRQCLDVGIDSMEIVMREIAAWKNTGET
jgi:hypothetical protein